MKSNKRNKRALILAVSSILALQQAVVAPSFGIDSSIIDAGGNKLSPNGQNGSFNFRPDAFKDDIGFKHFQEFILGNQDVANFIFQWYNKEHLDNPDLKLSQGDISKFVTFIDGNAQIHGIINALNGLNGQLKSDGQLIFVAPNGLVVGSSGVLNVGSLSVLTPTQNDYDKLIKDMPTDIQYAAGAGTVNNAAYLPDKVWDPNSLTIGNGTIQVDGAIMARGNVELNGGKVTVGPTGGILASIGGNTDVFASKPGNVDNAAVRTQAEALFDKLVKTDNMVSGNEFSAANGNIVIKSNVGTNVADGGLVRTYGSGNITIDNTGIDGVIINGEVANHNGNLTITNAAGKIASTGAIKNKGIMEILNHEDGIGIDLDGIVENDGTMNITNETGTDGLIIRGDVTNNTGKATITNKENKLDVESDANVVSNGSSLLMDNSGANGMNIKGHVDQNNKGTLDFKGTNSNIVIGDNTDNDFYVTSDGETTFTINNGNLYNSGVAKTLIQTTDGANLTMNVTNGAIGKEVGPCDDGVCTGIGPDGRDWTKSVNVNVDGVITARSTKGTNESLINLASANKDMNLNSVKADGRVILLADDINNKATDSKPTYSILNRSKEPDTINIEGTGISVIAGKDIGEQGKKVTFRQNGVSDIFDGDSATNPHVPDYTSKNNQGVDMLAIRDINVKGMDGDNGEKMDTNVCAMISRTGNIDAQFSGNTYIREITADKNIDLVTNGKNLYIENLGLVPSYPNDYYGPNENVIPDEVRITALDLGSYWDEGEAPHYQHAADSTVVIKNGRIDGTTAGRPYQQDLNIKADNVYAGGYYFNMGKHRGEDGKSTVTPDGSTNPIKNPEGEDISIRVEAVRPEDVEAAGGNGDNQTSPNDDGRNYYYGGSEQGDDPDYDVDGDPIPDEDKGGEDDDDNLVVPTEPTEPEPTEPTAPTEPTEDTTPTEPTEDTTPTEPTEDTTPTEPTEDTTPTEPTEDTTPTEPTEDTTPTEPTEDTTPTEPTEDTTPTEPTEDTTPTEPTEDTTPTEPTEDTTPTIDTTPTEPSISDDDVGKLTWVQRKDVSDGVPVIDKRQYMRFDLVSEADMVEFESDSGADAILNISRGGVQLSHHKSLKVGDVIPVKVKYGDLEINANVKIVSASDVKAGGEFIDLDQATANKLLYLNLMLDETANYAEANMKPIENSIHIQ